MNAGTRSKKKGSSPSPPASTASPAPKSTKKSASSTPEITLFADGSCLGNPGPGGYACILRDASGREKEMVGGESNTTNNRMELLAVITGLTALKKSCKVLLVTDSQYVIKGANEWMADWKARGWKNSQKEAVKNRDLWEILDAQLKRHEMTYEWVRGHTGHPENERCDELAREEAERIQGGY